jgi:RimJ/RimL family protein N-acetyltransferase
LSTVLSASPNILQNSREHTEAVTVSNRGELVTRRLHLRCPVEADASAIIAIAGDWDVARRLGRVPHPYTEANFRFFIERVVQSEPTWAIVVKQSAELVGVIGLAPHGESRSAELGYYVARPYWGQGLATEAAQAIVHVAFEVNGYAKLTSGYHADNPASGRVLAKLGFKPVGRSSRPCLAEGKDKPSIEVELIA